MKIVIDIPEELYKTIKKQGYIYEEEVEDVALSIIGGTPLPKGHGDLIDRNVAYTEFENACCSYEGNILRFVPVVIKADKREVK